MRESGSRDQIFARAEDNSFVRIVVNFTRAILQIANGLARAGQSKKMVISMKVNGKKTKNMV